MGYDPLLNLVLDETVEYLKGTCKRDICIDTVFNDAWVDLETGYITDKTRTLGLAVLRGTAVILISPFDGSEEIENPFLAQ